MYGIRCDLFGLNLKVHNGVHSDPTFRFSRYLLKRKKKSTFRASFFGNFWNISYAYFSKKVKLAYISNALAVICKGNIFFVFFFYFSVENTFMFLLLWVKTWTILWKSVLFQILEDDCYKEMEIGILVPILKR